MKTTSSIPVKSENELYDYVRSFSSRKINAIRLVSTVISFLSIQYVAMSIISVLASALWVSLDYYYDVFPVISPLTTAAIITVLMPVLYNVIAKTSMRELHEEMSNCRNACDRLIMERIKK